MKYPIFAMKDELAGFGTPHIVVSAQVEERDFKYAMSKDPFSKDKSLWWIGTFDSETGEITPCMEKTLEGIPNGENEIQNTI